MSVVEKSFYKGEVIVKAGDIGDSFFRLIEGKASVYADWDKKDTEPFRIALLETGEYFGEMGLLEHTERSATAAAMEADTCVTPVNEDNFGEFIRNYPGETLLIMQQLSRNLRTTSRKFAEVCRENQALSQQEGTK